ncbi:hypothetical protein AK830_g9773 [Neonectria ditissima]|uniref:Transcription factor domain-containing protein n=1 Tax=Neonectria ditissima TaxID=78410 RepID=A0A0P7ARD1_9HYPO|nr:hypothetical protein AK830_g9773 [Neonectria ditissima]
MQSPSGDNAARPERIQNITGSSVAEADSTPGAGGHSEGHHYQSLEADSDPASQWDYAMLFDPPTLQDGLFRLDHPVSGLLPDEPAASIALSSWDPSAMAAPWNFVGERSVLSLNEGETIPAQQYLDESIHDTRDSNSPEEQCLRAQPLNPTTTKSSSQSLVKTNNLACPTLPRDLSTLSSTLSNYFFRDVITLYCTWDSSSNIMRNILEKMWQSSGALHHTVLSMAAACLSEDFPHLSSVARTEYHQALEYIQGSSPQSTKNVDILLAYMLLGHTASWLNPQNLATDMFRTSYQMLQVTAAADDNGRSLSFFSDTMDYWAMLLVYLTDSNQLGDYQRDSLVGPADPNRRVEPHPYSGISRETVRILTDIGVLIFQYRKSMSNVKFLTEKDLDGFRTALREARRLERSLLAYRQPDVSRIIDTGDPQTPLNHLQRIDEAYRCTGLLQIYRVFPDLLNERYAPWAKDDILRPPPATHTPSEEERDAWLTRLALHILDILQEIPFESRTRSVQPFIMVAVSGELRRSSRCLQAPGLDLEGNQALSIDNDSIEEIRARKFVGSRLAAYTHILPLHKIRVIFELINCVWAALDAGERNVYWLDVAQEKNLGTMMG